MAALLLGFAVGLAAGCVNFADEFATYCQSRTSCSNNSPCCSGFACVSGQCVSLGRNDGGNTSTCTPVCSGTTPYCQLDTCVECQNSTQCTGRFCNTVLNKCVECVDNSVCATPSTGRTCNVPKGVCEVGGADAGYPPAVMLELIGTSTTLLAGQCSNQWTVRALDVNNAPTALAPNVFLSGGGNARFFTNGTCMSVPTSVLTVPAATSQLGFFLSMDQAGTSQSFTAANGPLRATRTVAINAGGATQLTISPSLLVSPGTCSNAVEVRSFDTYGNASRHSSSGISLTSSNGTTTFFSQAGCPAVASTTQVFMSASSNVATYWFLDTSAGSPVHTASAPGLTAGSISHAVVPQSGDAGTPTPTVIAFDTVPAFSTAGIPSPPFTVKLQNGAGQNAAFNSAVTVSVSSATSTDLAIFSDQSASQPFTTLPPGATGFTFYLLTSKAANPYDFNLILETLTGNRPIEVRPNSATKVVLYDVPSFTSPNVCVSSDVGLVDAYGNAVYGPSPTIEILSTPAGNATLWAGPGCTGASSDPLPVTISMTSQRAPFTFKVLSPTSVTLNASTKTGQADVSMLVTACKSAGQACVNDCCSPLVCSSSVCQ
ncbi:MAG: hypothetical protein ACT4TC_24930 [Myxococcaceae bacterium]